jgi:hypothetical protein
MEMIIVKDESTTWNDMWDWVANHPLNEGIDEPTVAINTTDGECWQYMGSFKSNDGRVVSEFRHRNHPIDNERHYIKYAHTVPNEDIERALPVR